MTFARVAGLLGLCFAVLQCGEPVGPGNGIAYVEFATRGSSCAIDVHLRTYCWGLAPIAGGAAPDHENCSGGWPCNTRPARVAAPRLTAIAVGVLHACGLDVGGRAICWGSNLYGQMGTGTDDGLTHAPHTIATQYRFSQLSANGGRTCGTTLQGDMVCWGDNEGGALLPGDPRRYITPVVIPLPGRVAAVSNGTWYTQPFNFGYLCALLDDARTYCWRPPAAPALVDTPVDFTEISAGSSMICGRSAAGEVYCWGGTHGVPAEPFPIPGSFQSVSVGSGTACGVTTAGELQCWGYANDLIHGEDQSVFVMPPVQIPLPAAAVAVRMGPMNACALGTDRHLYCWGAAHWGYLGNGQFSAGNQWVPVRVLEPRS